MQRHLGRRSADPLVAHGLIIKPAAGAQASFGCRNLSCLLVLEDLSALCSGDTAAVLESQVFVFGGSTVSEVLQQASQATGAPVHVAGFIRFVRGEGVVKPARPSFADEVRQQLA
ncbi:hypothetical protein GGH15_002813 [Coemansia sp. RSA 562]|nr:hypothetical protein GGH15_002813 [Coemansia sp. RSA 562]